MARNSNWSEEEVTLALVLYLSLPFASISARNPKVVEFANLIGRTPGAVSFKLGNLGHCDASLQARGINGLSNISKVDRAVWERYIGNGRGAQSVAPLMSDAEKIAVDRNLDLAFLLGTGTGPQPQAATAEERLVLQKVRVSQQFFRTMILAGYGNRCAVSGLKSATLVEAAHIIPWAEDESLRLLPANGIALNSLLHRAYDCFLIGIDGERRVHVSRELLVDAEDSRFQSFFESINGAALQLSRHFTPSPELLERRFAQFRKRASF